MNHPHTIKMEKGKGATYWSKKVDTCARRTTLRARCENMKSYQVSSGLGLIVPRTGGETHFVNLFVCMDMVCTVFYCVFHNLDAVGVC